MQKLNYGLIVSDFDGTLVSGDGTILPYTKEKIMQYQKDGGKFALSTGRMPDGILTRAKELGLKGAVSCCQGSVILDIESKEILYENAIPKATAIEICEKLEEMDLHIHTYTLWDYYSNKDDEALKFYEKITNTKALLALEKPVSQILKEQDVRVYKFLIMVRAEDNAKLFARLEKENFEGCTVTKSADVLVEIVNAKNSKGTAVEFLASYYGVPLEKTVAIGDQWNDIPMIERAGLGVAVANADGKLKASADFVCRRTNEEGAVAEVIEKYGYTEE